MHLIDKIKGLEKRDMCIHEDGDVMEVCSIYAKQLLNNDDDYDDDDVCVGNLASITSNNIVNDVVDLITDEEKNLLRYYYYILHEVDDARAGTLDSDTLKKITSMVSAEWQERHGECFDRLLHEIKRDYITSMKKSIVDFVLLEPFDEVYEFTIAVSIARRYVQQ